MPQRHNIFFKDNYYHIYNRGAGKQNIFLSDENYRYCLELIHKYSAKFQIKVIAYCLMPNHYHFLLRQDSDIPISDFMRSVFNSYVQSFNRWYQRSGTMFQGRFKHLVVEKDSYVLQLCRYIHLNPVAAHLVGRPEDWIFSDFSVWIDQNSPWQLDNEFISCYFSTPKEYQNFVMGYLEEKQQDEKILKYLFD